MGCAARICDCAALTEIMAALYRAHSRVARCATMRQSRWREHVRSAAGSPSMARRVRAAGSTSRDISPSSAAGAPVSFPAALEPPSRISPVSVARADLRPAGFWIRVVAVIIDTAVILVAQAVLYAVASMVFGGRSSIAIRGAAQMFGAMLIAMYPMLFHWRWGQTLGKMAVDIRVVSCRPTPTSPGWLMDSGPLTLGCAALRQLASLLSSAILGVGYLMAGLRRRQAGLARSHRRHPRRAPPVTLPLPLRNRLAELVLEAFHDHAARRELESARRRWLRRAAHRGARGAGGASASTLRGAPAGPGRRAARDGPRPGRAPVRRAPLLRSA